MDGFKKRLNQSVQLKLSVVLSAAILILSVAAGVFSFFSALDEAHELQDDVLRQVALLAADSAALGGPSPTITNLPRIDDEARVIITRLDNGTTPSSNSSAGSVAVLPATLDDGLHTITHEGKTYRVLVTSTAESRIAVAQESGFRNEIARDGALRTVMPFLVLVPVLLLLVADLIRKMFRPIAALSKDIDQRDPHALHPLDEHTIPVEIRPFIVAINRLLARVSRSVESERRFVADAAHELRSPLTALSLQAERLAHSPMPTAAQERLILLRQGIERNRNLLDQLLNLAKAQSDTRSPASSVSVQSVFRRVLEDLMPLAEAKAIDLGVEGTDDASVWASESDLIMLVRNLLDNAIRYTPSGGRVDLSALHNDRHVIIQVQDSGPGIAVAERDRVFNPFYRTLGSKQAGSGLGLSIVQAVAQRYGAKIDLYFSNEQRQTGLRVAVAFPSIVYPDPLTNALQ